MADRHHHPRTDRKGSTACREGASSSTVTAITTTSTASPFASTKRITTAAELSLPETLAVMDEATELPPFGFNIGILEQRLKQRLGFEVTKSAIHECLLPYYNLREWEERYVMTTLGTEMEDFPGKGSGNHPPISPLKEFDMFLDARDSDEDLVEADRAERSAAEGRGGRKLGGGRGGRGSGSIRARNPQRSGGIGGGKNGGKGSSNRDDMELI